MVTMPVTCLVIAYHSDDGRWMATGAIERSVASATEAHDKTNSNANEHAHENDHTGHVRIYELVDNNDNTNWNWIQLRQDIPGVQTGEEFVYSVSLSSNGEILAIGAPSSSYWTENDDTTMIVTMTMTMTTIVIILNF